MNEEYTNKTETEIPATPQQSYADYSYTQSPYSMPIKPPREKKRYGLGIIAVCVILSLLCGFGGSYLAYELIGKNAQSGIVVNEVSHENELTGDLNSSLSSVVAETKDSVVEITTESTATSAFVGQYVTEGAGSGIIIANEGGKYYVLTNNHVVSGTSIINVTTSDGTKYPATVVGTDSTTDIAVVSIEASGLTVAKIGDSDALKVGDAIIAIGNPLGSLGGTVTEGIVSALNRDITINGQNMNLLQISAAVNPGNSGGGLFNAYGELVGVVNAKSASVSADTYIEGLGFAVPINTAMKVATSLMENGYVTGRPVMGVTVLEIGSEQAAYQAGVTRLGVYITEITPGFGAEKAGAKAKDYIVSINGTAVTTTGEVTAILNSLEVGDTIEMQVIRDSKTITLEIELMEKGPEA